MLASVPRRLFNEWIAYHSLDPWGDEWQQSGTIAAEVHNSSVMAGHGKELKLADNFIPYPMRKAAKRKLKRCGSMDEEMALMQRLYGQR